ncbi:MAG: amino acid ABC transporter ATP-binding protein [Desulfobacterales bacterium]|nr:MAG: amino acid ABC transporter ATP-binding protein [Desulfobacterales bacterium]
MIKVRGLHKYFGPVHIIKGVGLDLWPSEVIVIMGPSGGGKSTFLRCLNFLEEQLAGTIEVDGVEVNTEESASKVKKRIRQIRRNAAMIFQEFNLFPHMTVLGNIIEGAVTVKKMPQKQAIARAEELLASMGLLEKRDDFPSYLAAGEQQRVAIARSLFMEPKIILFDDPTSALDPTLIVELVDTLTKLANEGIAMIVVTNEAYLARNIADKVMLLDDGVWVEIAPPDELFTNPKKERTRKFLERISLKDISAGA